MNYRKGKAFMYTQVFFTPDDSQAGLHHCVNLHSQKDLQVEFYSKSAWRAIATTLASCVLKVGALCSINKYISNKLNDEVTTFETPTTTKPRLF